MSKQTMLVAIIFQNSKKNLSRICRDGRVTAQYWSWEPNSALMGDCSKWCWSQLPIYLKMKYLLRQTVML